MNDSHVLRATQRFSTTVASRTSRRSLIARATGAAFLVAVGSGLVAEDASAALQCDCDNEPNCNYVHRSDCAADRTRSPCTTGAGPHKSVTCGGLTGVGGQCPSGSTACGSWTCGTMSGCSCANGKVWTDCCATADQCHDESSCICVSDTDGVYRASCCYHHCYNGGPDNCNFIYCRFGKCF